MDEFFRQKKHEINIRKWTLGKKKAIRRSPWDKIRFNYLRRPWS